jgi:hypothetical protein
MFGLKVWLTPNRFFLSPLLIAIAILTTNPFFVLVQVFTNTSFETPPMALAQNISTVPTTGAIRVKKALKDNGYSYMVFQDFGTPPDTSTKPGISKLRIFENGIELGAAHSWHADIRNSGLGRFSHWGGSDGRSIALYFSSSDNTNPRTNGRFYTYRIDSESITPSIQRTTSLTTPPTASPTSTTTSSLSGTLTSTSTQPVMTTSTGRVYYVSPSGSDSNTGTISAPWRTIASAALKLAAGDTAVLLDGVYEEPKIIFANSGAASSPITIKSQSKWGAILSSTSGGDPGISISKSYITIEDLRITVSPNNVPTGVLSSANAAIRAWNTLDPTPASPYAGTQGFVRGARRPRGLQLGALDGD